MREYYLFKLKENDIDAQKTYLNLKDLYYLNSHNFKYGTIIFKELCLPLNKEKMIAELRKKFPNQDNKFLINNLENTIVEINNVFILIKTNGNFPRILKYINHLERNIIVCDFKHDD